MSSAHGWPGKLTESEKLVMRPAKICSTAAVWRLEPRQPLPPSPPLLTSIISRILRRMDQEAFRQLVSSSSSSTPSSSSSSRAFGKAPKRNHPSSTSSSKPSDLKPRHLKPSSSDYIDRAAARRLGSSTSSEFADVEALHRDFESRLASAASEEERQVLRDQLSSVGGDARYSVLVKGLDWGLLAQNRAKIQKESGGEGEGDELEDAYQENKVRNEVGGEGKRSREEIMEAIKKRRQGKGEGGEEKEAGKSGFRPGFKPIGAAAEKEKADDEAEYKWVDGKRMRRKKKRIVDEEKAEQRQKQSRSEESEALGDASVGALSRANRKTAPQQIATPPASKQDRNLSPPPTDNVPSAADRVPSRTDKGHNATDAGSVKPALPPQADDEDDDEDEDIFADVGGWDGIPDANEEEEEDGELEHEAAQLAQTVVPPQPTLAVDIDAVQRSLTPPSAAVEQHASCPPTAPITDALRRQEEQESAVASPSIPDASPIAEPIRASSPTAPIPETNTEEPSTVTTEAPQPVAKPKKSKWDDLDDDVDKKKKKKKKHH